MTTRTDVRYLAFDGGGTATRAALYDADGNAVAQATGGPSNPVEIGVQRCIHTLSQLGRQLLRGCDAAACEVAAGISGARREELRSAIAKGLIRTLGVRRAVVSSDVDALLHANVGDGEGMVVIAGTGSSVIAKTAGGAPRIFGGRGTLFGDVGSAYDIAVRALRAAAGSLDGLRAPTKLVESLPKAAGLQVFSEFVRWSRDATKDEVAALAPIVIELYEQKDDAAFSCVVEAISDLASLAASAAHTLGLSSNTPVFVHGGVFDGLPDLMTAFQVTMDTPLSGKGFPARVAIAPITGSSAGLVLLSGPPCQFVSELTLNDVDVTEDISATESRETDGASLDNLPAEEIVSRMSEADREAADAVANCRVEIAQLVQRVAGAFNEGGRLIYVGAGTSGRLGVLDASECPPTFGVDPGQVIGIIAGGDAALRSSGEGVEDDEAAAIQDLITNVPGLCNRDVVVGIAASGTTPYVHAALAEARKTGVYTCLLCCNPAVVSDANCVIALDTGPEVLSGSTRLKAGTATKLVLNMISTGAMALSGRIFEGYMVGVKPLNAKLRKRAIRMVAALTGLPEPDAAQLLESAGDSISVAVLIARLGITREAAETRLKETKGSLRAALDQD